MGYYVGIDIAEGSIKDCHTRYNGDADHHHRHKKFMFPTRLICGDCYEVRLDKVLADDAPFDMCSCQACAWRALAEVSALLRPGAEGLTFGNNFYWVCFDEEYYSKDAVDCPEGIVRFHIFKSLAEEYDFELLFVKNSHEFVHEYMNKPDFVELMGRLGALGDGNQD